MSSFEIRGPVPAGSGPLARLTAPEFSGKIVDPLKQQFVDAAERTASNVEGIRRDLSTIGWGIGTIATTFESLEHQLVPRFDSQLQYLSDQLSVLQSIDASLKSPRRVAAAERIQQTAHLLRIGHYDRALQYAREAIDHDATNPGGFISAGWALLGSRRIREAIPYFIDASAVAKDYQPWLESMRQLARCQLAIGDTYWALENTERAIKHVKNVRRDQGAHVEKLESERNYYLADAKKVFESRTLDLATLHYEASIAAAENRDDGTAMEHIEAAVYLDERFAHLSVGEPYFERHTSVPAHALAIVRHQEEMRRKTAEREEEERRQELARRESELPKLQKRHAAYKSALGAIHPWEMSSPPKWMKKEDYFGGKGALLSSVSAASAQLDSFTYSVENKNVSIEVMNGFLDAAWIHIKNALEFWINYKSSQRVGWGGKREMMMLKRRAQHIIGQQAEATEPPKK